MNAETFQIEDICTIIKTCSEYGVSSFEYSGLILDFNNSKLPPAVQESMHFTEVEAIKKEEIAIREEQLEQMLIEDPLQFEEMLRRGDVTDEDRS